MCGINGLVGNNITQKHVNLVKKMNASLHKRGPDASNIYINEKIIFGHTLLSVINDKNIGQPVSRNGITVMLNGEIYNYLSLKEKYVKNFNFLTNSDAEILIYLYLEYGDGFLNQLDGEFALALFDEKNNKLLLAVDHLGIKPLYYSFLNKTLIFSSQINSLLETGLVKKEFDSQSLQACFTLGSCAGSNTLFKNIKKLEGGAYLVFEDSFLKIQPYFFLDENIKDNRDKPNSLKNILKKSVTARSLSKTKVGVSLSGGVDSAIVGFFLKEKRNDAYSVGLDNSPYIKESNENKYRKTVVETIKTKHLNTFPSIKKRSLIMEEILSFMDDFAFHPMIFAHYFIYKKAQENNIRVLLSGDGSDELFLGYDFYLDLKKISSSKNKFDLFNLYINAGKYRLIIDNVFKHNLIYDDYFFSNHFYFNSLENALLFKEKNCLSIEQTMTNDLKKYSQLEILNQFLIGELKYKFRQPLMIIDRMASNHQVENRLPFLSRKMINYALNLSVNQKLKNKITKYPIKKIAETIFPKSFVYRPKMGLGFSIDFFIKNKKRLFEKILTSSHLINEGVLNKNYVNYLFLNILRRKKFLFTDEFIVFFFLWYNYYFEDKDLLNYLD